MLSTTITSSCWNNPSLSKAVSNATAKSIRANSPLCASNSEDEQKQHHAKFRQMTDFNLVVDQA